MGIFPFSLQSACYKLSICLVFHHIFTIFTAILYQFCINFQSDIIYSPTSGTSQDVLDVPSPMPLLLAGPRTPPAGPKTPLIDGGMMDGRMDRRNFSPFYRTASPV